MSGKTGAVIGGIVIVLAAGVLLINRDSNSGTTTSSIQEKCLTKTVAGVSVPSSTDTDISYAVMAKKPTVPAGTNANVYYKTYSQNSASGTIVYDGNYGEYNFTVAYKSGDTLNSGKSWAVNTFTACK